MTALSVPDIYPLPDAELVFGVSESSGRHAVTHDMAATVVEHSSIREAAPWALCGERVGLATKWGSYQSDSPYLAQGRTCWSCAWIVAAERGEVEATIAAAAPGANEIAALTSALGDPLAGVRLLEAIAADDDLPRPWRDGFYRRSQRTDLLALASRHQPSVLVCEECAEAFGESDGAHEGGRCAGEVVACMGCSPTAGPWAGEWEGTVLHQCMVAAPCSVVRTLCGYYGIPVRVDGARQ